MAKVGRVRSDQTTGGHVLRTMDEEKGRWARVTARAGERLARPAAVR